MNKIYIIILIFVLLIVLIYYNQDFSENYTNSEAISNIARVYSETSGTVTFNNVNILGNLNGNNNDFKTGRNIVRGVNLDVNHNNKKNPYGHWIEHIPEGAEKYIIAHNSNYNNPSQTPIWDWDNQLALDTSGNLEVKSLSTNSIKSDYLKVGGDITRGTYINPKGVFVEHIPAGGDKYIIAPNKNAANSSQNADWDWNNQLAFDNSGTLWVKKICLDNNTCISGSNSDPGAGITMSKYDNTMRHSFVSTNYGNGFFYIQPDGKTFLVSGTENGTKSPP